MKASETKKYYSAPKRTLRQRFYDYKGVLMGYREFEDRDGNSCSMMLAGRRFELLYFELNDEEKWVAIYRQVVIDVEDVLEKDTGFNIGENGSVENAMMNGTDA